MKHLLQYHSAKRYASSSVAALLLLLTACGSGLEPPIAVPGPEATCRVPVDLRAAPAYEPPADEIVRDAPVVSHLLAVSWSPQACRTGRDYPDARHQCAENRFGLTLHGLWPNGAGRRHPRYCAPARPMSDATARRHFCMTPSPALLQHEWAAHGTCGWDSPEAYLDQAARMWNGLTRPDLEAIPADRLTAGAIRDAFAAANPTLPRAAVWVVLTEDGWFREARLCARTDFAWAPCAGGVGPPDATPVRLAPRGTAPGGETRR